jgi:hypothetical protein
MLKNFLKLKIIYAILHFLVTTVINLTPFIKRVGIENSFDKYVSLEGGSDIESIVGNLFVKKYNKI